MAWRPSTADRRAGVRIGLSAGMAIVTWLVVLTALGILLRLGPLSFSTVLRVVVVVVMFWPVLVFAPWREGFAERILVWTRRHRGRVVLTGGLVGVTAVLVWIDAPRLVLVVLRLPVETAAGDLYGMSGLYREHVGTGFARALFRFGRWYLQALWLYVLASGLAGVVTDRGEVNR